MSATETEIIEFKQAVDFILRSGCYDSIQF